MHDHVRSSWGSGYDLTISFKESDRERASAFASSLLPPGSALLPVLHAYPPVGSQDKERRHTHGQATFVCERGATLNQLVVAMDGQGESHGVTTWSMQNATTHCSMRDSSSNGGSGSDSDRDSDSDSMATDPNVHNTCFHSCKKKKTLNHEPTFKCVAWGVCACCPTRRTVKSEPTFKFKVTTEIPNNGVADLVRITPRPHVCMHAQLSCAGLSDCMCACACVWVCMLVYVCVCVCGCGLLLTSMPRLPSFLFTEKQRLDVHGNTMPARCRAHNGTYRS